MSHRGSVLGPHTAVCSPLLWKSNDKCEEVDFSCFVQLNSLPTRKKIISEKVIFALENRSWKIGKKMFLSRSPWRVRENLKLTETFWRDEDTVCSHWCSEMFIKNPVKLAGSVRGDSLSSLYLTISILVFSRSFYSKRKVNASSRQYRRNVCNAQQRVSVWGCRCSFRPCWPIDTYSEWCYRNHWEGLGKEVTFLIRGSYC